MLQVLLKKTSILAGVMVFLSVSVWAGPLNLELSVEQEGEQRFLIGQSTGLVTINVSSSADQSALRYDWGGSSSEIRVFQEEGLFLFDPSTLKEGNYRIALTLKDRSVDGGEDFDSLVIRVVEALPILSSDEDTDSDGVDDLSEGIVDSDLDGIPDYLDRTTLATGLDAAMLLSPDFLIQCVDAELCRLGIYAMSAEGFGAQMLKSDFLASDKIVGDGEIVPVSGHYDLEVELERHGASVQLILPLIAPLPTDPLARIVSDEEGWMDFIEDSDNQVFSVEGVSGACPAANDSNWQTGLVTGFHCVKLIIKDGGENDFDLSENGTVFLTLGFGFPADEYITQGGGYFGGWSFLLLATYLLRRRINRGVSCFCCVVFCGFFHASVCAANTEDSRWLDNLYVSANWGTANSQVSDDKLQTRLDKADLTASVQDVESNRFGGGAGLGFKINHRWQAEVEYIDLGQVEMAFTSQEPEDSLKSVHPASGEGVSISLVYLIPVYEELNLRVRTGAFSWQADYETHRKPYGETSYSEFTNKSSSGTDLLFSFGAGFQVVDSLVITGELQQMGMEEDSSFFLRFGLEWFPTRLW